MGSIIQVAEVMRREISKTVEQTEMVQHSGWYGEKVKNEIKSTGWLMVLNATEQK